MTMKSLCALITILGLAACDLDDPIDRGADTAPAPTDFTIRVENIAPWTVLKSGTQAYKLDGTQGVAGPGEAFEVTFTARRGHHLSFATMLRESNDWFFAPDPQGIPLFSGGRPISGDVTPYVKLWNAGTELDQEPAVGDATAARQPSPGFGAADPDPRVRELGPQVRLTSGAVFARPPIAKLIRVTLTPGLYETFTLRIANLSTEQTLMTSRGPTAVHLSPLAWTMHLTRTSMFDTARTNGLEQLAEDGLPDVLGATLRVATGLPTPLSPGVFAVHRAPDPLFVWGRRDYGHGLESLAEDGDPVPLRDALAAGVVAVESSGVFDTPIGAATPGPAMPGQAFELHVTAVPGDAVSFATMYAMSNDWFFATDAGGIGLFDGDTPRHGNMTGQIALYDAGTELDEELGVGPDTAPQQAAPNTGELDYTRYVRGIDRAIYAVPAGIHLRVTLESRSR